MAILMVVGVHVGQHVPSINHVLFGISALGQYGVQLFFVVSSITLCMSATSRQGESHPLVHFYSRRFFRIAPAYWVGIIFYMCWSIVMNEHTIKKAVVGQAYTPLNMLVNALFLNGFYPPANNNIVPGGWSIGTEMAFYVIFPVLWAVQKRLSLARLWMFPLFTLLLCEGLLYIVYRLTGQRVENNTFWYYNILNQLIVFVIGICAYRHLQDGSKKYALWLFLSCLLVAFLLIQSQFVYAFYLGPLLVALAFAGLALFFSRLRERAFMNFLVPIGKVSFSMYLFHFAIIDCLAIILQKTGLSGKGDGFIGFAVLYIMTAALTFLVARLSYRFIEVPGIAFGKRVTDQLLNRAPLSMPKKEPV